MFDDLAVHPLLLAVLDAMLGASYQLSAPTGIEIAPGEKAQFLHTDDAIYPLPRPHGEVVLNTMWALDDFTAENGATRVVPGSHRWTDRQPIDPDETVTITMPAGSVLFIRGTLWHGGGANRTDRTRLGVLLEYAAGWLRQQENHVLAVPPEIVRTLEPRLQELIGYGIHPPFVGYVDGRHPRRVLDRPNLWSPLTESNRRPSPYHGDALPTELRGRARRGYNVPPPTSTTTPSGRPVDPGRPSVAADGFEPS